MNLPYFDAAELENLLPYETLIPALEKGFSSKNIITPPRHHHNYPSFGENSATLLLMPSWEENGHLGVKLVTVNPGNHQHHLPSIQGVYLLFDDRGTPVALMDARTLTTKRTAAASALASQKLSRKDSEVLLMVGTGVLAPELIKAHCAVRPIKKILVWGRDSKKAKNMLELLPKALKAGVVLDLEEGIDLADIISVATLSQDPLIFGKWIRSGQHLDLVGSFKPDMREVDDDVVQKCNIYIDTEMAMKESGDLYIPLSCQLIDKTAILGTLFDLCRGQVKGRVSSGEITMFKSVGHGLEDLVAANLAFRQINKG